MERTALLARYTEAKQRAVARGAQAPLQQFEQLTDTSQAVLCRPWAEVSRLALAESEIYATFYQRTEAGLRIPDGDPWDRLRAAADALLFGDSGKKHVRFGALSLDGVGLERYGECSLALKEKMIAHRSTLIERNSVVFMKQHRVSASTDYALPTGYRAGWADRGKLAVAKLADAIEPATAPADFARRLLNPGPDGWGDDFVEVHIWGSLTIRSMEQVVVRRWQNKPRKSEVQALRAKLKVFNVVLQVP